MKRYFKVFLDKTGNLFASQDSKYFLATALKVTLVPLFFFSLAGYSIWNLMELNFNFFVAHGFHSGEEFKETFYLAIFGSISQYIPIFTVAISGIFLVGLGVAWLALQPFGHIENFTSQLYDDPDQDLDVSGLNKSKLIYQVSRIFFKYLQILRSQGQAPLLKLPHHLENLNKPRLDKVFLFQYACIAIALCLGSSLLLVSFTSEFYEQIVENSTALLSSEQTVTIFISEEIKLLEKIRNFTIFGIILGYISISFSIIKGVDGVTYGFARDMLRVVSGEHDLKLRPRNADPGKSMATGINDYLEEIFPFHEDVQELNYEEASKWEENRPPENIIKNDLVATDNSDDDLPPTFIEERQDLEGNKIFHITTPKGLKVENLNEDMAVKVVLELESKKKAS